MRELDDVREMLGKTRLSDVMFTKVGATRRETPDEKVRDVERSLQLLIRETDALIHARVDLGVSSSEAEFELSAVAIYEKSEPFLTSRAVRHEFLEKVGLFTLWPYLRAQLQTLCDGLSVERIVLPTIQQGHISIEEMIAAPTSNSNEGDS